MPTSPRVQALLDRGFLTWSAIEWRQFAEEFPGEFTEFLGRLEAPSTPSESTRCRRIAQRLAKSVPFQPQPIAEKEIPWRT